MGGGTMQYEKDCCEYCRELTCECFVLKAEQHEKLKYFIMEFYDFRPSDAEKAIESVRELAIKLRSN
jgi:hypothetical protein